MKVWQQIALASAGVALAAVAWRFRPMDKAAFVRRVRDAVQAVAPDLTAAAKVNVIAHAAYESGYGRARPAARGRNFWNLNAGSAWTGGVIESGDKEYQGGKVANIVSRFRAYLTDREAVRNYLDFLRVGRHAEGYRQLVAGNPTFVYALRSAEEGGSTFYTLPASQYVSEFARVRAEVVALLGKLGAA